MFSATRLRLTLWYLAILTAIVGLLSAALCRILITLQQAELKAVGQTARHGIAQVFARDEGTLAVQIVALDVGILILAALGAYVLAGRTLEPIVQAMEGVDHGSRSLAVQIPTADSGRGLITREQRSHLCLIQSPHAEGGRPCFGEGKQPVAEPEKTTSSPSLLATSGAATGMGIRTRRYLTATPPSA